MGRHREGDRRAGEDVTELPKTNFNPPFNITRASHLSSLRATLPAAASFIPR